MISLHQSFHPWSNRDTLENIQRIPQSFLFTQLRGVSTVCHWASNRQLALFWCFLSALTHITRIRRDFDATNSPRYRDDNTLPHIARFHGEFQETLCKSREAFIARRRLLATDKNRHFLVFDKIYLPFVVSMSIHSTK